jgi:hypothetical protein
MMKILGVDPGIHGGLAIIVMNSDGSAQLIDAIDIPTVGIKAKERVDAQIPEAEWEEGIDGKPRPPWVMQFLVYLIDPATGETYTFLNSTTGARIANERLQDKFKWMRALRGNVVPIVKLDSRPMQTKFGQKMRPEFTVLEWRELAGGEPQLEPSSPKQIEQKTEPAPTKKSQKKSAVGKPVKPVTVGEEIDDGFPPWAV